MAKWDTNLQKLSETIHITVEELRGLEIKRLEEYLYKNEELDCYIQDVIAADGKETNNTGKKKSEKWLEDRTDWKKLMSIGYERKSISKKRRMKRFCAKIGRNLETEIPVILAFLKILYDSNMLDVIDELAK